MEMQSIGPDINELGDGSSVRAWLSKKGINKDVDYNHSRRRVEDAQNKTLQHLQKRDERKAIRHQQTHNATLQSGDSQGNKFLRGDTKGEALLPPSRTSNFPMTRLTKQTVNEGEQERDYTKTFGAFDEAIVTREEANQVSEQIKNVGLSSRFYRDTENKFRISDTRTRPKEILLRNPCEFSIFCVVYMAEKVSAGYSRVAKHTFSAYQKCVFNPIDDCKYRFKFYTSKSSETRKREAFVPVNLPHGADFDLYYSVKAAQVKLVKDKNKKKINSTIQEKPWLKMNNGKPDNIEEVLLKQLLARRAKSRKRSSKNQAVQQLMGKANEKTTQKVHRKPSSSDLSRLAEKDFEALMDEEEERLKRLNLVLDECNKYVERMKVKVRADIKNYKERIENFQNAVRNYGEDNLRKSLEEIRLQSNRIKSRVNKETEQASAMQVQYRSTLIKSISDFQEKQARESRWWTSLQPILILVIQYLLLGLNMIGLGGVARSVLRKAGVPLSKTNGTTVSEQSTSDDDE